MDTQPVAIMGGIEELRQRVAAGHHDYAIMLAGGAAISRKTIRLQSPSVWQVTNHIDNSRQTLINSDLWSESHIGLALDGHALLDMDGDRGLVLVAGSGYRNGNEWLDEVRAALPAPTANDDPLRYVLDDGPGAIKLEDGDWEPADPALVLEVCEIGPSTVASIDLAAIGMGFMDEVVRAATTSIELTIEDIDALMATLSAIREDAIANRGFALRANGYWGNEEAE